MLTPMPNFAQTFMGTLGGLDRLRHRHLQEQILRKQMADMPRKIAAAQAFIPFT